MRDGLVGDWGDEKGRAYLRMWYGAGEKKPMVNVIVAK